MDPCFFLTVRFWPGFSDSFPFDRFDGIPLDDLHRLLQETALERLREFPTEVDDAQRLHHEEREELPAATAGSEPSGEDGPRAVSLVCTDPTFGDDLGHTSTAEVFWAAGWFAPWRFNPERDEGAGTSPTDLIPFWSLQGKKAAGTILTILQALVHGDGAMPRFDILSTEHPPDAMALRARVAAVQKGTEFQEWAGRLGRYVAYVEELAAAHEAPDGTEGQRPGLTLARIQKGMLLWQEDPNLSERELGSRIGVSQSTVNRSESLQRARMLGRRERMRGFKSSEGDVEAIHEDD